MVPGGSGHQDGVRQPPRPPPSGPGVIRSTRQPGISRTAPRRRGSGLDHPTPRVRCSGRVVRHRLLPGRRGTIHQVRAAADLQTTIATYNDAWHDRCELVRWVKDADTTLAKATHPKNPNTDIKSETHL